ncbi:MULTISPECIES: type II secretion system protein N [unclassified Sphingomonas]|uniref:type II secretion system protein N n=1 Tax=Novosphingobium rhizosphaerae TaxID=1551649 RepID=UPI0015C85CD1
MPTSPIAARLAEVALLGSAGALLAMLCWVVLAPLDSAVADDAGGAMVLDAPARAGLFAQFDPFARESGGGSGDAGPLRLLGTRSTPDGQGGSAILAGADGVQHVVAQGEEALPGVRLAQVAFDYVVLLRAGGRVTLSLAPQDGTAPAAAPSAPQELAPQDLGGRFALVTADGKPALWLTGGAGQSWGLLPDDRIVAIGGAPVRGQEDAARLDAAIAQGRALAVTVRRGGRDLPLSLGSQGGGQ